MNTQHTRAILMLIAGLLLAILVFEARQAALEREQAVPTFPSPAQP